MIFDLSHSFYRFRFDGYVWVVEILHKVWLKTLACVKKVVFEFFLNS